MRFIEGPVIGLRPKRGKKITTAAGRFFERRLSVITRAFGSPKMPRTVCSDRKPVKQVSHSRRLRYMPSDLHAESKPSRNAKSLHNAQVCQPSTHPQNHP